MTTPNDSDPAPSEQAQTPEKPTMASVREAALSIVDVEVTSDDIRGAKLKHAENVIASLITSTLAAQSAELEQHKTRIGIQAGRIAALESERNGLLSELEQARAAYGPNPKTWNELMILLQQKEHDLATATARLAERDAQVAELVRDKERLDFMESCISTKTAFAFDEELFDKQGLRAAIDAAISKPQP